MVNIGKCIKLLHKYWMLMILLAPARAAELYVSPQGSDRSPGTIGAPFRTLERARDEARKVKRRSGEGVTVFLRGGIYYREETFELSEVDSGSADRPVIYASAPGEIATLFGGRMLDPGWFVPVRDDALLERVIDPAARSKLVACDLGGHGIINYGKLERRGFGFPTPSPPLQLFVGGRLMTLARYPNQEADQLHMGKVIDKGPVPGDQDFMARGGTFSYDDKRIGQWATARDIWLNGIVSKDWAWTFNRIAKIDPTANTVTLAYGEKYGILNWKSDFFHVENLIEEIDMPGEYFLDHVSGLLYVLPPADFDTAPIAVSTLADSMVRVDGTENVVFQGIIFDTSRRMAVDGHGKAVRIDACEIVRQGLGGVHLEGTGHVINSCTIHQVGGTAIRLDGGDWKTLTASGCVVENCHIHHWGDWQRVYCPAVDLWGVGHVVRHSEFDHFPHNAIQIRGNDHLIEYNLFHDGPLDFKDMGVIYANLGMYPHHRGSVIRRNFFRDVATRLPKQNAIYPDNGTMDWLIEENVFYRVGSPGDEPGRAIGTNGGSYLTIRNNVFVDCRAIFDQSFFLATWNKKAAPQYEKRWNEVIITHDFATMPHGRRYPALLKLLDEDRKLPDSCIFEKNLIWNPTVPLEHDGPFTTRGGPVTLVKAETNFIATEDPGFADWKAADFTIRADATVYSQIPGFLAIPFDQIGRQDRTGIASRIRPPTGPVYDEGERN